LHCDRRSVVHVVTVRANGPMRTNQRKAPRKSVNYPAWIAADGGKKLGCLLSDISESGARIRYEQPETLPDNFVLLLGAGDNAPRRVCRVVWRADAQVGVQFQFAAKNAKQALAMPPNIEPGEAAQTIEAAAPDGTAAASTNTN
jgi:PilZ domain